ncbi:hypothetical protein AB0M05_06515 [Streptomyces violaceusniger]|uniref:hypothetical protein n=1 Tax=Streptomyces violaceusniger TaxID=68280 RepID=UPI0034182DE6
MRPSRLSVLSALSTLSVLAVTLLPTGGAPAAATPPAQLTVTDPGFEQEGAGWTLTSGAGTATNLPHGGNRLLYLDAGPDKKASQTITARRSGTYDFSAWVATGGPGAHFTVRVNGKVMDSVALPSRPTYARYTVSRVALIPDDRLEIAFESGDGWVNADDVMVSPSSPVDPTISSSDPRIVEMFTWSKRKANSWVQLPGTTGPLNVDENHRSGTGTGTYGPAYWAGYAHRSAYYSRDFAHQLGGAAVLGLGAENKAMLRSYAASATAEHRYYPVWSLNFDTGTAHAIDYHGPDDFVREVPATFELVEKANEAYRWSGDRAYLDDTAFWDYYRHATEEFVDLHDGTKDNGKVKVAEGTGKGIFAGAASYNEEGDEHLAEAGDGIAAQYQAYRALAELARDKGDRALAAASAARAERLKEYFNATWSGSGSGASMVRAYRTDGTALTGWGKENSWFMPMKGIIDPGPRNDAYLDYIDEQASGSGRPVNIEALTYLPDTFFRHNRADTAWKWMRHIYDQRNTQHTVTRQGPNGDYPEVSFTLLSQTVQGLMGVAPDAPRRSLTTQSRLPSGMDWLKLDQLRIGKNTFSLRHDGTTSSTLAHTSGGAAYTWEARFPGRHGRITVDGKRRTARTKTVDGVTYTYAVVSVAPGMSRTVRVG